MDSNTHNHLYDPNHMSSSGSGLLRFRSAPSSVLAAFVDDEKSRFDSDRLLSRFVSSNGGNDELGSPNPSEFEDTSPVSLTNTSVSYAATLPPPQTETSSFLGLPPHYPRQSKGMMSSVGLDQFLGMNNHHTTKPVESSLLRQSSSPAGMFTNLSDQNGTVLLSHQKVSSFWYLCLSECFTLNPKLCFFHKYKVFTIRQDLVYFSSRFFTGKWKVKNLRRKNDEVRNFGPNKLTVSMVCTILCNLQVMVQ